MWIEGPSRNTTKSRACTCWSVLNVTQRFPVTLSCLHSVFRSCTLYVLNWLVEATPANASCFFSGPGWRAEVRPSNHPVSNFDFDVVIGADGRKNTLDGERKKGLFLTPICRLSINGRQSTVYFYWKRGEVLQNCSHSRGGTFPVDLVLIGTSACVYAYVLGWFMNCVTTLQAFMCCVYLCVTVCMCLNL